LAELAGAADEREEAEERIRAGRSVARTASLPVVLIVTASKRLM